MDARHSASGGNQPRACLTTRMRYSPGWFEYADAERRASAAGADGQSQPRRCRARGNFEVERKAAERHAHEPSRVRPSDALAANSRRPSRRLSSGAAGKTVIAGYPWFLDWGRDSLICARGMLAAGMVEEVKQLLITYGRFATTAPCPTSFTAKMLPIATRATRRLVWRCLRRTRRVGGPGSL